MRSVIAFSCAMVILFVNASFADESRFGLDYIFPTDPQYVNKPFAQVYKEAGLTWVNFGDVRWKYFEKRPPKGDKHFYEWQGLDHAVRHWQKHGFDIVMTVRTGKAWFSGPMKYTTDKAVPIIKLMIAESDRMPKEEHMIHYETFIKSLVERYDGDGVEDMPGLIRPVLHYQIGNEYGNPAFWTGSVEQYYRLLTVASRAARSANITVRIIPNGLRTNDAFHNDPHAERLESTMGKYESQVTDDFYIDCWKRMRELDEGSLQMKSVFDVVDAGGNGSWHTTSQGYYTYVRRILDQAGNQHIPIWDMESRNEPLLTPIRDTHIYMELGIPKGKHIVNVLKNPMNPQHQKTKRWYRAEQARITAKVFVAKFAAGNEKVFMGMPMDWDKGIGKFSWPNPFMGFVDSNATPWPAYYTLKLLVNELDGFSSSRTMAAPSGVALYKFDFGDGRSPVWVAWVEDIRPRGVDSPLTPREVTLRDVFPQQAFEIPTLGENTEPVQFSEVQGGIVVTLNATPVFFK